MLRCTYSTQINEAQLLLISCFGAAMLWLSVSRFNHWVDLFVTVCCGFPPGTENDRNGLSMLSNELSPAQSPDSKVRTQLLIGQLLNRSMDSLGEHIALCLFAFCCFLSGWLWYYWRETCRIRIFKGSHWKLYQGIYKEKGLWNRNQMCCFSLTKISSWYCINKVKEFTTCVSSDVRAMVGTVSLAPQAMYMADLLYIVLVLTICFHLVFLIRTGQ